MYFFDMEYKEDAFIFMVFCFGEGTGVRLEGRTGGQDYGV